MTTLKVPDMHCENCVKRINAALDSAGIGHSVSLKDRTVAIDGDATAVKAAINELGDLGFDAAE